MKSKTQIQHSIIITFSTAILLFSNCCRARLIGLILFSTVTVRFTVISFGYFERSFAANASVTGLLLFLSCASSSLPDGDYQNKKIIQTIKNQFFVQIIF